MSVSVVDPLFVEYLRQARGADFDAFCAAHPEQASQLRELKAASDLVVAHLRAAGLYEIPWSAVPISEALLGATPSSGELLQRIVSQGSKGARYRLRGEIARGGMGAILKVWDDDLGRELAMKVVLGTEADSSSDATMQQGSRRIARFIEEAQITGQLDHPCVVPVHEIGLDSHGRVYFTMRLVRGRDLDRIFELVFKAEEGWTETRALGVLLRACEAMAYAHSKGVVHRDLKPANVMVGSFGEVYVMDWGLARVQGRPDAHDLRLRGETAEDSVRTARRSERTAESDSGLITMEGDVVGTPAYMPPEQARGKIEELSPRSDVYALGAMLYHLLARRMPYFRPGETRSGFELLRDVLESGPRPLRELRRDVPAELEAICEKAMARKPADRYVDTLELADDLRAFLEGRVVKAYQTGALVELRKWIQRNRALATAAGFAVVFLIAGLIASLMLERKAEANAKLADSRAGEARESAKVALEQRNLAGDNAKLADQRAAQAQASAELSDATRKFLEGMLSKANPRDSLNRDLKVSTVVSMAVKQLDDGMFATQPETECGLRETLGTTYASLSLLEESERQLRIASDLQQKIKLADPLATPRLEIDLGNTLLLAGRYSECATNFQNAIDALEEQGAAQTALMARALVLLGSARYNLGSTSEAIDLVRRSLALREQLGGPQAEDIAITRSRLGFFLGQNSEFDEALKQLNLALDVLDTGSDVAHYEASEALRHRAAVYESRREMGLAEADLREALARREALLGEESIGVADVLSDLAAVLSETRKTQEAEALIRRSLVVRRKLLGVHRDTATCLTTLATIVAQKGDKEEARELLTESLTMRLAVFAPESVAIGDSLRRLGALELDNGELDDAEKHLNAALANWKAAMGSEYLDLAMIERNLAKVHVARGQWEKAKPLLEHALALNSTAHGEIHPNTSDARDQLITTLMAAKDWVAAEKLLRDVLPKYQAANPQGSVLLSYLKAQLGAVLVGTQRYDEAEPLLLEGWKAIGDNPRMWAVNKLLILDNLVALYAARGAEEQASVYREKATALRK